MRILRKEMVIQSEMDWMIADAMMKKMLAMSTQK